MLNASFTQWLCFCFDQTRTFLHSLHRSLSVKSQNVVIWLFWSLPFAFHCTLLSVHSYPCHPLYRHWFQSKKAIGFLFICLLPHSMCSDVCSILLLLDTFRSAVSLVAKKCLAALLPTSPFGI